jgi:hypothetical protein
MARSINGVSRVPGRVLFDRAGNRCALANVQMLQKQNRYHGQNRVAGLALIYGFPPER